MDASGQCFCGAVSFTIAFPSKWVAHCHCTICQRAHGAAFVTWVSVDESRMTVRDSEKRLTWHESSADSKRGFCSRCGSHLFFRSSRWPGEWHIARANFTTPVDREPQVHAFYETHVPWFVFNDELPKKPSPTT
jgi:hypothetical protein